MKYIFIFSVFIGLFLSCRSKQTADAKTKPGHDIVALKITSTPYSFTMYDKSGHLVVPDKKLTESWKSFIKAVQTDSYDSIKYFSTCCIACAACLTNTEVEDSVSTARYLKHANDNLVYEDGENPFLAFDLFFKNDYKIIFNSNLKSRMPDSIKVGAHYDEANKHIYSEPCIIRSKKKATLKL